MFEVLEIEEMTDGRVWAKWRTIADDGFPLEEGDYFTPETDDLEGEIEQWLRAKQQQRQEINERPRPQREQPKIKRRTARLSSESKERLKARVSQSKTS